MGDGLECMHSLWWTHMCVYGIRLPLREETTMISIPTELTLATGITVKMNGSDTGLSLSNEAMMDCLEPVRRNDFVEAQRRCQKHAHADGLPRLAMGLRYSFGAGMTYTIVSEVAST